MALNMKLFKVEGSFLRANKWDATLSYGDADNKGYVIAFSRSQVMDWLLEFRGTSYEEMTEKVQDLKSKMKTKQGDLKRYKEMITKQLFLDELIQVDFNSAKDFDRCVKGFKVNGVEYKYLTSKGSSTVTFIRTDLYDEVASRLDADRDKTQKQFPSKLSAYKSLAFTSSVPVTEPKNIIVIPDCNVQFQAEYLWVGETIEHRDEIVTRDICDGCCLVTPELAKQWSKELNHPEKILSAFQVRNLWTKGILFPVDYKKYCIEHGVTTIVDVWGTERNILDSDLILNDSMLKLWKSYNSMEEWLEASKKHGYVWRVGKFAHPNQASKWGFTNYQIFLPMQMNEDEIEEMLQPSIDYITNVTCNDYVSTLLYLHGKSNTEESIKQMFETDRVENTIGKALMIEPRLLADKGLQSKVKRMLSRTKSDIKMGRFDTDASLVIIVCDAIQLLEHLCGVKNPKGVLKKGEVYSKYHLENGYEYAIAQRNPMLISNNLIKVKIANIESEYSHYFKYLDDVICVNGNDLMNESLCGLK